MTPRKPLPPVDAPAPTTAEVALANFMAKTEGAIARLQTDANSAGRRVAKMTEKMRVIDPEHLLFMEERHRALANMFQQMIEKMTVVTEVCYLARHDKTFSDQKRMSMLAAAICALDEPADFWKVSPSLTVAQWAVRCLTKYRENKLLEVTRDEIDFPNS